MDGVADIASIVSAAATCVALVFAGFELRRSRTHDQRKRRIEIEGVAVSWVPIEVPRTAQDEQGIASWVYQFTACNPGPLPISDVRVEIHFALKVQRVHYDGHRDDPADHLVLVTPVLAGGGERTWRRRLLMSFADSRGALPMTQAEISFIDPDDMGKRQRNHWPKNLPAAGEQGAIPPDGDPGPAGSRAGS
ncbi:MAG: hypothetical protein ACR2MP_13790 [Streptosporangiaceae bacterium]